jgi:head-tail adaptor
MAQRGKYISSYVATGTMTEEIAIQTRTATNDGQGGGYPITWATIATEWAKVTELSYERQMLDQGIKFTKVCQFDMRERGDTYTMAGVFRIYWKSQYYTVYSVVTNEGRTTMLAYA